jgi:hypothetical protein
MRRVSDCTPVNLHGLTVTEIADAGRREAYRLTSQHLLELAHARLDPHDVVAQLLQWLVARSESTE